MKKRWKLKQLKGLTWLQKLAIEQAIEYAIDRASELEETFEDDGLKISTGFRKLLAIFRKKTKHMKPPRKRRRRRKNPSQLPTQTSDNDLNG